MTHFVVDASVAVEYRGLPLLTADGRLARASGRGIVVQSVRTG